MLRLPQARFRLMFSVADGLEVCNHRPVSCRPAAVEHLRATPAADHRLAGWAPSAGGRRASRTPRPTLARSFAGSVGTTAFPAAKAPRWHRAGPPIAVPRNRGNAVCHARPRRVPVDKPASRS